MLYPAELLGRIHKILTCMQSLDSNDLPLRRRPLYPTELRGHNGAILAQSPARVNDRRGGETRGGAAGTGQGKCRCNRAEGRAVAPVCRI